MKKDRTHLPTQILPFLLPLTLMILPAMNASVLMMEGFETDGEGIRYTTTSSFTDGTGDYFIRTDGTTGASGIPAYTGYSGNFFWAAEDIDASENPTGLALMDFSGISLAGYSGFQVSLDMGAGSQATFDSVDDFVLVQYRVDAGSWNTVFAFQNDGSTFNSPLLQDTDFDGIGDGALLDLSLQTFVSSSIPTAGNLLDLRIDTVLTGAGEAVAFDNLMVMGIPEPSQTAIILGTFACLFILLRRKFLPYREIQSRA